MTSKAQGNILTRNYYAWKSLKLPWRRKVSVTQWPQWLRHNRVAPTIAELHANVARQAQLKQLAAAADARWNAKPSLLNAAPRPPVDSVLESNTKFCDDSGLQRREEMRRGRGETGVGFGGKDKEGYRAAGESPEGEFKVGEWGQNAGFLKKRPGRE
ncbi:hypothetical protein HOY82DRAFT_652402 [Tuber indicum]|nr:hypothetical protein HOY82DRAFT_652402 [Tuber indicum]